MRDKISLFCNVDKDCIIENANADSVYEVPLLLESEKFADIVCRKLHLKPSTSDLTEWRALLKRRGQITRYTEIGLVGKYVELHDAYLSVVEALNHAGIVHDTHIKIRWIQAETLTTQTKTAEALKDLAGVIVPGGFGERGVTGMINAVQYVRVNRIPFFGICLGMQCAVIDVARHCCGLSGANSLISTSVSSARP